MSAFTGSSPEVLAPSGSFVDRLSQELSTREMRFLVRSFGIASGFFFSIGWIVACGNILLGQLLALYPNWMHLYGAVLILAFLSSVPSFFMNRKWDLNPLGVSRGFTNFMYFMSTFQFVCFFLVLLGVYGRYELNQGLDSEASSGLILTAATFGSAWLVYLIPVFVGWFVIGRDQAIRLNRFLFRCCLLYLFLASVLLLSILFCFGKGVFRPALLSLMCFLALVLATVSPVVSLFRFKVTARYIDFDDRVESEKWQNYFVYVIMCQLLILAYDFMRLAVRLLGRR